MASREDYEEQAKDYHEDEAIGLPRGPGDPDTYGYPGEEEAEAELLDAIEGQPF